MVDYINWNGKDWPVKMAGAAITEYESKTGEPLFKIGSDMEKHALFLWIAIKVAYRKLKEDFYIDRDVPVLTQEDCFWMIDECYVKYMKIFGNSFAKLVNLTPEQLEEKTKELQAKKNN